MRKYLPILVVLVALAGACKSGDDDSSASEATTTTASGGTEEPSEATAEPGRGVTDDAIKLGITHLDLEAIRDVVQLDHGDYQAAYTAIIEEINADGGVNGRLIEPVFAPVNPIGTDPATEACIRLTEDEQVFAAIGFFQAPDTACYVTQHDTAIVGGSVADDAGTAPWFNFVPQGEDLHRQTVEALADDGAFDGATVAVIANAVDEPVVQNAVLPALEEAGVDVVETAIISAPGNDVNAAQANVGVAFQRFEESGVDLVVASGGVMGLFEPVLAAGTYRPRIVATDNAMIGSNVSDGVNDILAGGGGALTARAAAAAQQLEDPEIQHCVELYEAATGTTVGDPTIAAEGDPENWVAPIAACQNLALFVAIAEAAGPGLNNDTFGAAGDSLGEIDLPGLAGLTYSAETRDGAAPLVVVVWDPDQRALVEE